MPDNDLKNPDTLTVISFVALVLAAALFFYMAFIRTADQNRRHFQSLAKEAESERQALDQAKNRLKKDKPPEKGKEKEVATDSVSIKGPISDVPMFLQKINKESLSSGMELINIEKVDNTTYRLRAYAPFYRLVNFLFKIEQANLAVGGMDIKPFSAQKDRIYLTLKVIGDEMSEKNQNVLEAFQKAYGNPFRNPFQRDPGANQSTALPDVIDLTYKFKLSGIGLDARGKYAMIDHKNYHKDQTFNDMTVVAIQKDRVELKAGSQNYVIGFRYKRPVSKK
ncbi:MAG: hypothetical protein ABII06_19985 [Pseudomonadota bacterium]